MNNTTKIVSTDNYVGGDYNFEKNNPKLREQELEGQLNKCTKHGTAPKVTILYVRPSEKAKACILIQCPECKPSKSYLLKTAVSVWNDNHPS